MSPTSAATTLFCWSVLAYGSNAAQAASAVVTLPNGASFEGTSDAIVDKFLGIQYGEVGRRFSRSTLQVPTDMDSVSATAFGPNCHQTYRVGVPEFIHNPREEAEECLYLNIWRPANVTGPLTTMVWIHSGGFAIGSGADNVYEGSILAGEQNVIVVNINYRLGVLGLLPQDETGFGGMNSLYDQIVALQWVHENIESFGGDPDDVTVFGESAGGESVCMLSVSPLAKGLFQRAIQQSGECINNNWAQGVPSDNIDLGLEMVDQLLSAAGAASIEDLTDSDRFPATELQSVTAVQLGWPVVILDKEVLPLHPKELYLDEDNVIPTDIIVGSNSYEDAMFFGVTPDMYAGMASGLEEWVHDTVGTLYGDEVAEDLVAAYSPTKYDNKTLEAFAQFNGDYYIRCPAREFASVAADVVSGNVYLYNFAHYAVTDPIVHFGLYEYVDTSAWASHLADLPFVFGTLEGWNVPGLNETANAVDYALSAEIRLRWANFAKTGQPTGGSDDSLWTPISEEDGGLPAFVFEAGVGDMQFLPRKLEQCSAFPFSSATAAVVNDTTGSAGPTARGSASLVVLLAAVSLVGMLLLL